MKTWVKILVVCVSGGAVWGLSFVSSLKPDMAMMLATINSAIVAVCSYITGYPGEGDNG